jgi:hypothetical protein
MTGIGRNCKETHVWIILSDLIKINGRYNVYEAIFTLKQKEDLIFIKLYLYQNKWKI